MNIYGKISIKIIAIVLLVILFNFIYKKTLWEKDIQTHSDIIEILNKVKNNSEILYFAESSNISVNDTDLNPKRISDFIADYYPGLKIGTFNKAASHARIYLELLKHIPENSNVHTVIITVNLRSFGAQWIYSDLETSLMKSLVMLKNRPPIINRFLLSFKGYDYKTEKERKQQVIRSWRNDIINFPYPFDYSTVIEWDKVIAGKLKNLPKSSIEWRKTELSTHYIKAYAFQIDTVHNLRIKDFDNIVILAKKRRWNLIFNLLAENIRQTDSLVGKDLVYLMKQNRDLLVRRYKKNGVKVVDNLEAVPVKEFTDTSWTTEHYNELKRKIIARNVAFSLKDIYNENFVDPLMSTSFSNNFEGSIIWQNMHTLTSKECYSGLYSSKVDTNNQFGATFVKYLNEIPIPNIKSVEITIYALLRDTNSNAQLAIELYGDKYFRKGENLNKYVSKLNIWQKINIVFDIENVSNNKEFIKVYVMNDSKYPVYFDDVEINFIENSNNDKVLHK